MKNRIVFSLLFLLQISFAQVDNKKNHCTNSDFDKKVASYLNFTIPTISVQELHSKPNDYLKLDAREFKEYQVSHIPGAKFIGYSNFNIIKMAAIDKKTKIVVYCSIGYRSEKIGEKLKKQGFTNVYNLYGSIFEWANMDYPLEKENNLKTKEIHGYNKSWSKWVTNPKLLKTY
jgi:rhodanese-related sulfurtransferase